MTGFGTGSERSVLDNPTWSSLTGPHAGLAEGRGLARRYPPEVSPFHAVSDDHDPAAWSDLLDLVGPGGVALLTARTAPIPDGWTVVDGGQGVQLVGHAVEGRADDDLVLLGADDVPEMIALVERTRPGPFLPRTVELGGYLGVRDDDGRLVAMAGYRLNPVGFTEISAVCTDESHRGKGLGTRLVLAAAAGIRARGEVPIMHAAATNTNAIRLYESLGFTVERRPSFELLRAPG